MLIGTILVIGGLCLAYFAGYIDGKRTADERHQVADDMREARRAAINAGLTHAEKRAFVDPRRHTTPTY